MIGLIIGLLALVGIIVAVICCVVRIPENLRGFYGTMFCTIAVIAIVSVITLVIVGLL